MSRLSIYQSSQRIISEAAGITNLASPVSPLFFGWTAQLRIAEPQVAPKAYDRRFVEALFPLPLPVGNLNSSTGSTPRASASRPMIQIKERFSLLEHSSCIGGAAGSKWSGVYLQGTVMTGARIVLAILTAFALLTFASDGRPFAAGPGDRLDHFNTALISTTNGKRAPGERQLLTKAFTACILATYARSESYFGRRLGLIERQPWASSGAVRNRIFKSNWRHVSTDYSVRQNAGRRQIFDVYLPSYPSLVKLLHYPVWFKFCRPTNST
jgi:hypothetical protein